MGLLGATAGAAVFRGTSTEISLGLATAWLVSSASVGWLLWSQKRSLKAFWWAFGGGMALRAATLAGLMVLTWRREGLSAEALLLSYVFGVLAMLLTMEMRHLQAR